MIPPPIDPIALVHFLAVQSLLSAAETAWTRRLPCEALRALIDELSKLSIPDAVRHVRFAAVEAA